MVFVLLSNRHDEHVDAVLSCAMTSRFSLGAQAQCQLTPEAEARLKELTKDLAKDEKSLAKVCLHDIWRPRCVVVV